MSINGVDTQTLFATLDAVKAQPELAKFQFRQQPLDQRHAYNCSTINGYYGAGQEFVRATEHSYDAMHPPARPGRTKAPHRWSSCCMPCPPASPAAWPTSRPRAASR